jgi:hypothetical protein
VTERPIPQPGDFFVTEIQGRTFAGSTHRWVQLGEWIIDGDDPSPWSHAGCVLDGGRTLEAMPGGAIIGSLTDVMRQPHAFSSWSPTDLPDSKRRDLLELAPRYIGVGYSALDYAAIGLHDLAPNYDAQWLRDYIDDSGHLLCSQLVADWYTRCDLHHFNDNRWPGYVKPSDLGRVLTGPQPTLDRRTS